MISQIGNVSSIYQFHDEKFSRTVSRENRGVLRMIMIAGIAIIGFSYLDNILSGRIKSAPLAVTQKDNPPVNIKPCILEILPYKVTISGECEKEKVDYAYKKAQELGKEQFEKEERERLEREKQVKEVAKREANEYAKKSQEQIELERAAYAEYIRRLDNPTADEQILDQAEIDKEIDRRFKGWSTYTPKYEAVQPLQNVCPQNIAKIVNPEKYWLLTDKERILNPDLNPNCKEHARIILKVDEGSLCNAIRKEYYRISQIFYPKKCPEQIQIAEAIWVKVNTAYKTLC